MSEYLTRRGRLGPGDDGSGDEIPVARSNVVPLPKKPIIQDPGDPTPRTGVTVNVGDDGIIEIAIGTDEPEAPDTSGDFDRNLALDLDDNALAALAQWLIEGVETDIQDRAEWETTANLGATYLGVVLKDPQAQPSTDGAISQVIAASMLKAQMKLWATARAELLPVAGPVKVERVEIPPVAGQASDPSQDPVSEQDAVGDDIAQALEKDLNWYLTRGDRGYYPDTKQMLWHRTLIGVGYKKVFRCPIERKPLSRWVMGQNLVVSGNPATLQMAKRVTEIAKIDQGTMRRLQASGYYRDVTLAQATGRTTETEIVIGQTQGTTPTPTLPRDFDHEVYETCCNLGSGTNFDLIGSLRQLDLDENGADPGYPLPYIVALDADSRTVLSIRRNWKKGDPDHRPRRRYVKYGFLPGFGFYDLGLIHIAGKLRCRLARHTRGRRRGHRRG